MNGREQPPRFKKSVTFKIRADEAQPTALLQAISKPPLAQSKRRSSEGDLGDHHLSQGSQNVNQQQVKPEVDQRGSGEAQAYEALGDSQDKMHNNAQYNLI